MTTIHVLETIGYPEDGSQFQPVDLHESREDYILSRKNKISSQYLSSLSDDGEVELLQEEWAERQEYQHQYKSALENISKVLSNSVDYAIIKSAHGFLADSKDVDILLFDDELSSVKKRFLEAGYDFQGASPSSVDVLDSETGIQLDIQDDFTLQSVIYFDKSYIQPRVQLREYQSAKLPIISQPDDLALIVIHSITEQLFILKEYYAAVYMLENFSRKEFEQFIKTVEENRLESACSSFFTIVAELSKRVFGRQPRYVDQLLDRYRTNESERQTLRENEFTTPHRYSVRTGLQVVSSKLRHELFLRSVVNQIPRMVDPRVSYHIISSLLTRRAREHYVHDTSSLDEGR